VSAAPEQTTPRVSPAAKEQPQLLRFATAGSVDDGKSTLIGRLLHDTRSVLADQLAAVERASRDRGLDTTDLALLTDGLRAEREQGITIDVAYRYFATPRRKFIIADTPGHIQYTRNMVTGASTADLALILVDARKGLVEQSRRHAFLCSLLRVPHLVLCVNKMDLVDFSEDVFEEIADEFTAFAAKLEAPDLTVIPISALHGDNIVTRSARMPWYDGPALLHHLVTCLEHAAGNLACIAAVVRESGRLRSDDVLHREANVDQIPVGGDVNLLEMRQQRGTLIPRHVRRLVDHVIAVEGAHGNHG